MIYHFGGGQESWLPGGFLGVDIFFVLSGYLITGLLLTEYQRTQRIGLAGFWARRVRRLVPALVVVLLAVIAWIWWATPPESYPARRTDLFWTIGYLANWHLIGTGDDYFAAFTTASPLRHAWSLAVEEQFYLVWPLLVAGLLWLGTRAARGTRWRLLPLAAAAGGAALLSVWVMASAYQALAPSAAYYNTFGRVQELFAGVLLAVAFAQVRAHGRPGWLAVVPRRAATGLALAAGACLVVALCTLHDDWPGYYRGGAFVVSLLTAVLIGGVELRPRSGLAQALSWRPAVALGRISYGVYLWHWPVLLAIPIEAQASPGQEAEHQAQRVALTLVLATLSFWLVERPVLRERRWLHRPAVAITASVAALAVVAGAAVAATALPGTMSEQLTISSDRSCPGESIDRLLPCVAPVGADPVAQPPSFALLGDSTARGLGGGLDAWAQQTGNTWIQAGWKRCTATGLLVVRGMDVGPDLPATSCTEQAPGQIRTMLSTYRPGTVIIMEFWPSSLPLLVDGQHLAAGSAEHAAALGAAYRDLVDEITGYGGRAVFVELAPPGDSIGATVARGRPAETARMPALGGGQFVDSYNAVLRSVVASRPDDARLISLTDVICPAGSCPASVNDQLIRVDGVHFAKPFGMRLAPILLDRAGVRG
jgi:peptidoglycan/LPS O-acetylase OafA/YrhL